MRNVSLHKSFFVRDHYPPIASLMCEIEIRIYCHSEVLICCDMLFFLFLALRRSIQGRSHCGFQGRGGTWHPPTSISKPKKAQQFHFQTSGILFFMGVQNYTGQKFLPCILQFLDNLRRRFTFSNYIGAINQCTLDLPKRFDT